jgi:predicted phosphodiesterase
MTRYAVVGDIHGNERALDAALSETDELGFDQRIFIGDLLT